jgi:hypothetical protein
MSRQDDPARAFLEFGACRLEVHCGGHKSAPALLASWHGLQVPRAHASRERSSLSHSQRGARPFPALGVSEPVSEEPVISPSRVSCAKKGRPHGLRLV